MTTRRGRARVYLERGQPVEVLIWWAGRGPRNVLIRRGDGELVVRPFRGLRRPAVADEGAAAGVTWATRLPAMAKTAVKTEN